MSEYQYYEFQAVDRRLTEAEQDELRSLSSRAEITSTSFSNEYNYGSFRGKVDDVLGKYFDAFVYVANWGTRRLMFRLPLGAIDTSLLGPFCHDEAVSFRENNGFLIIEFLSQEEGGDWEDGSVWMEDLLPARDLLLAGDLRPLYIGWLANLFSINAIAEGEIEPPLPPGLKKLPKALKQLAHFLRVDDELLAVAAEANNASYSEPAADEMADWLSQLPQADKDNVLLQLLSGNAQDAVSKFRNRFRKDWQQHKDANQPRTKQRRRTVGELTKSWQSYAETQRLAEAERKSRERAIYLDDLASRQEQIWQEVEECIASKKRQQYDRVVNLLTDLCEAGKHTSKLDEFTERLRQLRREHGSKRALLQRFDQAKLPK